MWMAATPYAPAPHAKNIRPSCPIAARMSALFTSVCTRPMTAQAIAVAAPTAAMIHKAAGEASRAG
jgi:hypothetical protein